jgi:hypothetical protein
MVEGLGKPTELIVIVVTFLSSGCPIQAMVQACGLDERTVACLPRSSRKVLSTYFLPLMSFHHNGDSFGQIHQKWGKIGRK